MSESGSTPEETEPRRIAGRYRLTAPLGSGAMGTVWAGYDEVLHRSVAIKELKVPPGVPTGEVASMRERMMREARTLGGLSHPNVITLYDVVDVSGDPFVVMELLPSRNLSEVIGEQGRLGVGQAASVGLAMTAALQAAHRAGITHRDVKPGNVLVAHDGRIKLTDFGIARKTNDVTMTQTGLVLGSPAYIAPEVASGLPVTPAADLWGLGATLFAAVEARPPYDVDGDPVKTVTAVVHAQVPRVQMGGPLGEVISALMVKDPERRMSLVEARRRLRPLLADPDDPLFPGSVDAYSPPPGPTADRIGEPAEVGESSNRAGSPNQAGSPNRGGSPTRAPSASGAAARGSASSAPPRPRASPTPAPSGQWSGAAPLAPDPGPLPTSPRGGDHGPGSQPMGNQVMNNQGMRARPSWQPAPPVRPPVNRPVPPPSLAHPQAGASSRWALPLVLVGALAVVLGAAGGWTGTRVLVGQSPLTTAVVSPAGGSSTATPMTNHVDSAQRYGAGALNFTASVPAGWEEYRLIGANNVASVRFVSPDGAREVRVDKLVGTRTQPATAADFSNGLTAGVLGVAKVVVQQVPPNQVRYWSDRTGSQGTSSRFSYAQLIPVGDDVWVVQLTVPADRAGAESEQLFTTIAQGFQP
ncbi:MAG: eukaryotic-like serine/threonine-protein kinase [Pseudonocardiales bacterium]|nr:eukaryotic-like serine/threonine-protein kinase [Pseudonocardiales bacterium]